MATTILSTALLVLILFFSVSMQLSDAQFEDYCVADVQYPEEELVYPMQWACSNGADCSAIGPNQACFYPNTTRDHASFAFNSYYQNMKSKGGNCYFIAAAVLTALNPSHDSCKFDYIPNP